MRFLEGKFTPHIIVIGLSSIVLLALSIALLVLEARVQDAFRDQGFQYPGSSIAEFIFVPLNPSNIDLGPTIVKFAVGACSLIVSLLSIVWPVLHWCRIGGRANVVHVCFSLILAQLDEDHPKEEAGLNGVFRRSVCLGVQSASQQ